MMQTNAHYQGCDKSRHTPQLMQLLVESLRADFLALQLADLFVKGSLFLPLDLCEPCSLCKLRGLCRRKLHGCAAVVWRQQTGSYATRRFAIQLGFAWRVAVTIVPLPRAQTEAVSEQTYDACKARRARVRALLTSCKIAVNSHAVLREVARHPEYHATFGALRARAGHAR